MIKRTKIAASRWYRIIPLVFITYSLAYLDRANFGFGAAGGMSGDLHLSATMSSLMGSLFFLGYFLFQIPGTIYATRKSARKLIFWSLFGWGLFAVATGIVSNTGALLVIRFMLGICESAVLPASMLLLSRWFSKGERSRVNTLFMIGNPVTVLWMSILSGYLIHAAGWRWMFICEGIPAILWAFFWWKGIHDHPEQADWLRPEDRIALEEVLKQEQLAIRPVKNYLIAFKSLPVVLLSIMYAFWSIGMYGFVIWLPSILHKAPGIGMVSTGWLSAVPYLMAVVAMVIVSYFSDKTLKRKIFIWPCLLLGAIAFYLSYVTGTQNFWLSFILLSIAGMAMYAPYGPFFAIITEILPANVAGISLALINSFGALGAFAGSYLVGYLNGTTGGFSASYIFMCCSLLIAVFLTRFGIKDAAS